MLQLEVRKEDPNGDVLASAEGRGSNLSFKHPLHLRESVTYLVTMTLSDPATVLYGNKHCKKVYEADGFYVSLSPGVFVQALVFFWTWTLLKSDKQFYEQIGFKNVKN